MEFRALEKNFPHLKFDFAGREQLRIEDFLAIDEYFAKNTFGYCINCAAYTAVDKAEEEIAIANIINAEAVGNLAAVCNKNNTRLIHFSTDYVFDGTASEPYSEKDEVSPVNAYGHSKLAGEHFAANHHVDTLIIRTSWVYSAYGKNFVKTMLRLMNEKEQISVVNDQYGCPTYAADLADAVMQIIANDIFRSGTYHYCNAGVITWFEFASAIREIKQFNCKVNPIPTSGFPTPAKRPAYSALDTSGFRNAFNISIPDWKTSLEKCLSAI